MKNLSLIALFFITISCFGQNSETIGLLNYDFRSYEGINLLTPLFYNEAYLINNCGEKVHSWNLNHRPGPSYLMPNGNLIYGGWDPETQFKAGGVGGYLECIDWNSNVVWSIKISDENYALHHDYFVLENGNILINVWERIPSSEVLAAGRNPEFYSDEIFSEKIMEITPKDNGEFDVVWEWRVWDHLIQDFDPQAPNYGSPSSELGKINLNYVSDLAEGRDWIHFNSLDYDAENDLILLSARHFNEIWIIDHSTTTQEASTDTGGNFGKGGDLIYRWGNPRTFNTELDNQTLFGQHDARFKQNAPLEIFLFNNGFLRTNLKSTVDRIIPEFSLPEGFQLSDDGKNFKSQQTVIYDSDIENFYSSITSGAQLLNNDNNLLITLGSSGHCYEIDLASNEVIWEYVSPVTGEGPQTQGSNVVSPDPTLSNTLFKMWRYEENYLNNTLSFIEDPEQLELNDVYDACLIAGFDDDVIKHQHLFGYNSDSQQLYFTGDLSDFDEYQLYDISGVKLIEDKLDEVIDLYSLRSGLYIISTYNKQGKIYSQRFIKH